ncbi:MAG: protein-disulfide reductase DsbD N-terminal domain-containing protein [Acidobacteriia bacterium]|nr:protein-disulfide reductase DsbD N-terminal domain-containing protein [Terriglobia bacterium]
MNRTAFVSALVAAFFLTTIAVAQNMPGRKLPSVTMSPAPLTTIIQGKPGTVELHFRIGSGFHINSNTPKAEYLIPTALKLDAPTDIVVGKITYPPGEDASFPFAPDEKLSVYSGEFTLSVLVRPLHNVVPSKYMFRGQLKYQACDNAACYPPKQLPVEFEVKIVKAPPPPKKNPPQSPHAHR